MQVGFHEPGQGFEVDERNGVCGGGVSEQDARSAAFLAVASGRALGVEGRCCGGEEAGGVVFGDKELEFAFGGDGEAAGIWVAGEFALGYAGGGEDVEGMRGGNADGWRNLLGALRGQAATQDGTAEKLLEGEGLGFTEVEGIAVAGVGVRFGCVADKLVFWEGARYWVV